MLTTLNNSQFKIHNGEGIRSPLGNSAKPVRVVLGCSMVCNISQWQYDKFMEISSTIKVLFNEADVAMYYIVLQGVK